MKRFFMFMLLIIITCTCMNSCSAKPTGDIGTIGNPIKVGSAYTGKIDHSYLGDVLKATATMKIEKVLKGKDAVAWAESNGIKESDIGNDMLTYVVFKYSISFKDIIVEKQDTEDASPREFLPSFSFMSSNTDIIGGGTGSMLAESIGQSIGSELWVTGSEPAKKEYTGWYVGCSLKKGYNNLLKADFDFTINDSGKGFVYFKL